MPYKCVSKSRRFALALLALTLQLASVAYVDGAAAATNEDLKSGCKIGGPGHSAADIANRANLISRDSPDGGAELKFRIRSYAMDGRPGLQIVSYFASMANRKQKEAIGEGLALAFFECNQSDSLAGSLIVDTVRSVNDFTVTHVFTSELTSNPRSDLGLAGTPTDKLQVKVPLDGPINEAGRYFGNRITDIK